MRKNKFKIKNTKNFIIMNKDAKFFCGLFGGEFMWSNEIKEAKEFSEIEKITMFDRYAKSEQAQIIYL